MSAANNPQAMAVKKIARHNAAEANQRSPPLSRSHQLTSKPGLQSDAQNGNNWMRTLILASNNCFITLGTVSCSCNKNGMQIKRGKLSLPCLRSQWLQSVVTVRQARCAAPQHTACNPKHMLRPASAQLQAVRHSNRTTWPFSNSPRLRIASS